MIICPECAHPISGLNNPCCAACGWSSSVIAGIPVMLNNADRANTFLQHYQMNYDSIAQEDLDHGILDEAFVRNLADNLLRHVGDVNGFDACDVGSGKGFLAVALARQGAKSVVAVDIARAYLARLSDVPNLTPVMANAENLPFEDAFDLVVSTDVMEHVLNLGSFLFCVNRALRTGGRFIVRVPYRENLLPYSPHMGCPYAFVHLRTFNKQSLCDCLQQSGFSVSRLHFDAFIPGHPREFWMRTQNRMRLYSLLQKLIKRHLGSESNVTLLPSALASLLMPPLVIIADVRKVRSLTSPTVSAQCGYTAS